MQVVHFDEGNRAAEVARKAESDIKLGEPVGFEFVANTENSAQADQVSIASEPGKTIRAAPIPHEA